LIEIPSEKEMKLVARCMLESSILIGSQKDIWTHPSAWRMLTTFRECINAITTLIGGNHGVKASFIKACVMQSDGMSEVPFALDEVAEFLVDDNEARVYWQTMCIDDMFPHTCPHCGAAAYIGYLLVECKGKCQQNGH
jgi:hypothetical protein